MHHKKRYCEAHAKNDDTEQSVYAAAFCEPVESSKEQTVGDT